MTTVTVGDYQYEVDVENEDISIVFSKYCNMTIREFSCEGLYVKDGDKFVPLHDYLIAEAIELEAENESEDFANSAADYARESANV